MNVVAGIYNHKFNLLKIMENKVHDALVLMGEALKNKYFWLLHEAVDMPFVNAILN